MIIELFGPPGAGKTTLTRALCREMADQGITVKTVNGYRLIEYGIAMDHGLEARHSIGRIFSKIVTSGPVLLSTLPKDSFAAQLLAKIPLRSRTWSWRMKVDIALLFESWHEAQESEGHFIFEEGLIQSLSALVLLARTPNIDVVRDCLAFLPRPDLFIQLDAPQETLRLRLMDRHARQPRLEVLLFELNVDRGLKQADLSREIGECVRQADWPTIYVNGADQQSFQKTISGICERIVHHQRTGAANGTFRSNPNQLAAAVADARPLPEKDELTLD